MKADSSIRPATRDDLPYVYNIFKHYVLNTTTSFYYNAPSPSDIEAKFETVKGRNLPYLVASAQPTSGQDAGQCDSEAKAILGYAYAAPFRPPLLAYSRSVEISLFVHPEHVRGGIGRALMDSLIGQLKGAVHRATESSGEADALCVNVRNVFAVVAHDVDGPGGEMGEKLLAWYERFGFEVVGRLKRVGWKGGRWIDTVYLQLDLEP